MEERFDLKCPDCRNNLHKVIAESKHGIKVRLDQCFGCGGIWFDNFELYSPLKIEIEKIESINLEKLREDLYLGTEEKLCPKCGIRLDSFKDSNFPKELEVEQCENCGGIWMNRGEAVDFKVWQEEKKKSPQYFSEKDREFQSELEKLLETHSDNNFKGTGRIWKALSLRIDPISNKVLDEEDYTDDEYDQVSRTASVAVSVFNFLLRLFLWR